MRRLSGQDDGFLHLESATAPMNSMAIGVLVPATGPDGAPRPVTMADVRAHMALRLGEMPSLRWRLQPVPFRLHHPMVIEDPDFDLDHHLRHVTLPAPGGPAELDRLVADLGEQRFDRRHPLWQLTLVDGLAEGKQAAIYRVQHALQDGTAAYTSFSRVFSGDDHEVAAPAEPWVPDEVPRKWRLIVDALRDLVRNLLLLPNLLARSKRGLEVAKERKAKATVAIPEYVVDTPPCSLNDAFTLPHTYARAALPLDDVKLVKNAAGVTLNDVLLAVVATALRRYLLVRHDLPEKPLTASVPVGFEPADAPPRQFGNRFTSLSTSLATDIADPWARMLHISAVTAEAKAVLDLSGPELMADWLEMVPPFLAEPGIHAMQKKRREDRTQADHSIVVSNLKGPSEPWRFASAAVESLHIQGPPSNGVGPNVMVWSYGEHLLVGILAFADAMAEPAEFAGYLADALDELVGLATAKAPAPA